MTQPSSSHSSPPTLGAAVIRPRSGSTLHAVDAPTEPIPPVGKVSGGPSLDAPTELIPPVPTRGNPAFDAPTVLLPRVVKRVVPAISVCVIVRDRPALLLKSLRSVLRSSFDDYEVVVVDDGSAVPVERQLAPTGLLADQRVRLARQAPAGISAARNAALRLARGRFVTVLDSDDELAEDGLARIHEFLTRTGARWVYTDYEELTVASAKLIRLPAYPDAERMLWSVLTRPRLPFKHSGMSIDRQLLLDLGGYDERMPIKVDVELVLRGLDAGVQLAHLAHPVVRFHRHDGNISRRRLAGLAAWRRLIRRYCRSRVPGLATGVIALRTASELGKWLVTMAGR